MQNQPKYIIVHHSAAVSPTPQFEAINEWHKAREFPLSSLGYYVGYHFVIEKDGTVRCARLATDEGAHTIGRNFDSIGICLVGNFDTEMPTLEQRNALGSLLDTFVRLYDIPVDNIQPHRAYSPKDCYGTNLDDLWAQHVLGKWRMDNIEPLPKPDAQATNQHDAES